MDVATLGEAVRQSRSQGDKRYPVSQNSAPASPTQGQRWDFAPTARPVIWDVDNWTDVDDIAGVRIAAWAEKVGLIDIRAVCVDTSHTFNAASLDAAFVADGRPGVPFAVPKTSRVPSGTPGFQANMASNYPNRGLTPSALVDAVSMFRRVLSATTRPVDIISTGYLNNLRELLQSPPDSIDSRTGLQLVTQTVGRLWVMGGTYPNGSENNFARDATAASDAAYVVSNWPTPITFSGFEVGNTVVSGGSLYALIPNDIIAQALIQYGSPDGRASWDPLGLLMAAYGDPTVCGYSVINGTNSVNASTGANSFTAGAGNHSYVVKQWTDAQFVAQLDRLLLPATQPATAAVGRVYLDGIWQPIDMARRTRGAAQPALPSTVTATADVGNLVAHFHAADVSDFGNGNTVPFWRDRMGGNGARQLTSSRRPTFVSSSGGRPAVHFNGSQMLITDALTMPKQLTVYARVLWSSLPSSNQSAVGQDGGFQNSSNAGRGWHIKLVASGQAQGVTWDLTLNAVADNYAGATVAANTWATLVLRRDSTSVEALLGSSQDGATALSNRGVLVTQPISIGSREWDVPTEGLIGDIAEIRYYAAKHTSGQVAAVLADMP